MFDATLRTRESPPASWRIFRYPSAEIDRIALPDGRVVTIRPVLPQDADAEQDLVRSLSAASRHRRFHMGVNALTPPMLQSMTHIDYQTQFALVAESAESGIEYEPRLIADARYVCMQAEDASASAEFAILVADDWQGVGLGAALMRRLMVHARRQGLRRLFGEVLAENAPMLALMQRLGARVTPLPAEIDLVRASFSL